ncbi:MULTISPECIES: helix-turn-helix transcriptional regulator [unclassified Oceanispirochaeta]|uniref:helix-turn-helix transcriptional regulator n=1 Tax=unclassified Oceanispirochaeta TaxID=2635722 RepID=UPI000E095C2F|nr:MULTISPECIES: helix-turn-helix transcriptional regulator [unclassified Oceanispirochaeta]MBF9018900.1 helix-turn-helix transcriptional regulator [Oceanispirochaeta sp. M2]NPD75399.1 helix-turn-helix transcriptional regulator [Oceanispirochaeta sp. M1]RDG28741.1 transcriptional regulator [Oceanispirochaeta sp. M1]
MTEELIRIVKDKRSELKLTQKELADHAGVGLRFIREMEQGKESLRLDKVNQVLSLFGMKMVPARDEYERG